MALLRYIHMHVDDSDFALDKGLFVDDFKSEQFKKSRHPCTTDFMEFAKRTGVAANRAEKLLQPFLERQPFMANLVSRSFLSEANKRGYLMMYNNKRNCLIVS